MEISRMGTEFKPLNLLLQNIEIKEDMLELNKMVMNKTPIKIDLINRKMYLSPHH
jgi:hypothetical protein